MANAYETKATSSPEFDWKGGVRIRRSYIVDTRPEQVPGATGLPAINDPHPIFTNARVDTYSVQNLTGKTDWSTVEVLYSSDRQFEFPVKPLDPTQADFNSWSMSFFSQNIEVPVAKRITRRVVNPVTGVAVDQQTWAYGPEYQLVLPTNFAVVQYRFTLTDFNPSTWQAIRAQVNKIHQLPDGERYRFEAGDITQATETTWTGTYSWNFDPGNFVPKLFNSNPVGANGLIVPNNPALNGGPALPTTPWFRPAYSQWALLDPPTGAPAGDPPHCLLVNQYDDTDLFGWQNLPGLT